MADPVWLAEVLRRAGLKVIEEPGWKKRGRGDFGKIEGVLLHHTAGALTGNAPSLNVVKWGRKGLRGPLSQLVLARDGTYHVVAAGLANHAGKGKWRHITAGNQKLIGIEAENTGLKNDPWPKIQYDAYVQGVAAILSYLNLSYVRAIAHKEWAPRRKIDPTFDMEKFREEVKTIMARKKKTTKKEEIVDFYPEETVSQELSPEDMLEVEVTLEDDDAFCSTYDSLEGDDWKTVEEIKGVDETEPLPPELPVQSDDIVELQAEDEVSPEPEEPESTEPEPELHVSSIAKGLSKTGASNRGLYAMNLLVSLGWKDYQAAAMIGNAMTESGDDLDTEAKGDYRKGRGYTSHGMCQWRDGRWVNLKKFTKESKFKDPLEVQTRFIDWELRNTEKVASKMLRDSKDIMEALRAGISYERPQGWSMNNPERGLHWKDRVANAYKLMRKE